MTKIIDKICKLRDLIATKDYNKLKFYKMKILLLKEEIHRKIRKKTEDYSYNIDFTSQDLRELAADIRGMLKRWEIILNPEKNIKEIAKNVTNNEVNMNSFMEKAIPIMTVRTECMQALIEFLNIIEYHSVYLYYLEMASNDELALKYTERLI